MVLINEGFDERSFNNQLIQSIYESKNVKEIKDLVVANRGPERTKLLGLVGFYYAFRPGSKSSDRDSALFYFSKAKQKAETANDTKTVCAILYGIGKTHVENGKIESANEAFEQAIKLARSNNDETGEAMAIAYRGTYSPFLPNTVVERIDMMRKADSLFKATDRIENQIATLTNVGYLSYAAGMVSESKQAFVESLKLEEAIKFPCTHYTLDLLSLIAGVEGHQSQGLNYAFAALRMAEASGDRTIYPHLCDRIGWTYISKTDNVNEAISWQLKALKGFEATGEERHRIYATLRNVSRSLRTAKRPQEAITLVQDILKRFPPVKPIDLFESLIMLAFCYAESNQASQAEKYVLEAQKLEGDVLAVSGAYKANEVYFFLGDLFFKLGEFEKARTYLNKALTSPTKALDNERAIEAQLAKIDSAEGNYLNAFLHVKRYADLNDSLNSLHQTKVVQQLQIQYETERKDNNIKILEQQTALHEAKIREDQFVKAGMIIGFVVLVVFLALLYNRFRIKQRTNKQLEKQQERITEKNNLLGQLVKEKEWLLKEVHHRVKNNLQIVISLLNTQSSYLDSDAAFKAIQESQNRIYAISLIHQKLYKSEDSALINIREYVNELVEHIKVSFHGSTRVVFDVGVKDFQLDVAQAVPLGLILNEAISNSIKYAFRDGSFGRISIFIDQSTIENEFLLRIADDGIGLPADSNHLSKPSFGIRLMQGLSKQMGGSFTIQSKNGVEIEVSFKNFNATSRMQEDLFLFR